MPSFAEDHGGPDSEVAGGFSPFSGVVAGLRIYKETLHCPRNIPDLAPHHQYQSSLACTTATKVGVGPQ